MEAWVGALAEPTVALVAADFTMFVVSAIAPSLPIFVRAVTNASREAY
jgi:hypothetical protein